MSLDLKQLDAEPSLKDLLDTVRRDIFLNLFVQHVATIKSFDSTKQTCTAKINYDKTIYTNDSSNNRSKKLVPYPVLLDVPVISLRGGKAGVSLPIKVGDQCLVLFNDRDIDNWFNGSRSGEVGSLRLHSMSDGFALVGISAQDDKIPNYDATRADLYNDTNHVAVGPIKTKIYNATLNLTDILQELVEELKDLNTAITSLTVTTTSPGNPTSTPLNAAAFVAINARMVATATKIGGLLE